MGRASRLTSNPDRERYRVDSQKARAARSQSPKGYQMSRSFAAAVEAAAMHEAGHIVAAVLLGFEVRFAILHVEQTARERRAGGYTEVTLAFLGAYDSPEAARAAGMTPDALRVRAMQTLAGRLGEAITNDNDEDIERGSETDVEAAMMYANHALGPTSTVPDQFAYMYARSEDMRLLLQPYVSGIKRVATYLIDHPNGEVPGDTLTGLIGEPE
jgi:hypothetical protein